jgi:hypothetical protein
MERKRKRSSPWGFGKAEGDDDDDEQDEEDRARGYEDLDLPWACIHCTFVNAAERMSCEVRPRISPTAAAEWTTE